MANKELNLNTVDDYIKLIEALPICTEEGNRALAWLRKYKGSSVDVLLTATTDPDHNPMWTVFAFKAIGQKYSQKDRLQVLNQIEDAMTAFTLYTEIKWLTDQDDELLLSKFKGKLPTAEAELAQGIIKRKKIS
jgi:hypothetical protein